MPFTFTMPKLSPTMEEGTIVKWHKKEGDFVASGDLLLEVATDKATVEHQALDEGWLRKIVVPEGGGASINQVIAILSESKEENIENFLKETLEKPKKTEEAKEPPQAFPQAFQVEKEIPPSQKPVQKPTQEWTQPAFLPEQPLPFPPSPLKSEEERIKASPLAKRLAKEKGLDLSTVAGSGPGGRISSKDLSQAQPAGLVTFGRRESPQIPSGSYEELPLTPMRKIIARRLQESKSFIPHFYLKQVIDAGPLVALREQLKTFSLNVTFNDLLIRGCALCLREHPEVNRGFNSVNQTMIQFKTIDISIAVNVEAGLITPIIRHADFKNVGQISSEMRLLAEKARHMKLKEHEYKGGSFCLSNLGMFGISAFTAILNPPQAGILAVGGIQESPIVKEGKVEAGKTLELNLSADHRVIDGALAATFMKSLQKILTSPAVLLL